MRVRRFSLIFNFCFFLFRSSSFVNKSNFGLLISLSMCRSNKNPSQCHGNSYSWCLYIRPKYAWLRHFESDSRAEKEREREILYILIYRERDGEREIDINYVICRELSLTHFIMKWPKIDFYAHKSDTQNTCTLAVV